MPLKETILAFDKLGKFLAQFAAEGFVENRNLSELNNNHKDNFLNIIDKAQQKNSWFTPEFIRSSFLAWSQLLDQKKIKSWLTPYTIPAYTEKAKTIGLIMAGNIPIVGFHDFLTVLLSGHNLRAKLSSKDDVLLPAIVSVLGDIDRSLLSRIILEDEYLKDIDALIATGSDNSSRYFEYYFKNIPHIIRKNRNSVAVLTGKETDEDLQLLADDVFMYFGLGCRNISLVFIPSGFDLTRLLDNFQHYHYLSNHNKFANNHDYQKAVLLIDSKKFLDNDFLILREHESFSSPIASLHYQFYNDDEALLKLLSQHSDKLQCIVSGAKFIENRVDYGKSQLPALNEYADNVDTMKFLLNLYS